MLVGLYNEKDPRFTGGGACMVGCQVNLHTLFVKDYGHPSLHRLLPQSQRLVRRDGFCVVEEFP